MEDHEHTEHEREAAEHLDAVAKRALVGILADQRRPPRHERKLGAELLLESVGVGAGRAFDLKQRCERACESPCERELAD